MSPHQKLILQESWKALEDAGYNPKKNCQKHLLGYLLGQSQQIIIMNPLQVRQMQLLPPVYPIT